MANRNPIPFLRADDCLRAFSSATATQDQKHIKPFHRHVSLRLVLQGGFMPDEITPHPPLRASRVGKGLALEYDEAAETEEELTVFGGMKTKQIDVVVCKKGIGPVVAISVKGTTGAYRNLVNRMEEAIGDSTNVHVMYPGLVYGFLHLLRANRAADGYDANDVGIQADGTVSPAIERYFAALSEMTGRRFVRNDFTRYESVGLVLVENGTKNAGNVNGAFPPQGSPLRTELFFSRLFEIYDLRFPFRAEHLDIARRTEWDGSSPLFKMLTDGGDRPLDDILGYSPRLSA